MLVLLCGLVARAFVLSCFVWLVHRLFLRRNRLVVFGAAKCVHPPLEFCLCEESGCPKTPHSPNTSQRIDQRAARFIRNLHLKNERTSAGQELHVHVCAEQNRFHTSSKVSVCPIKEEIRYDLRETDQTPFR